MAAGSIALVEALAVAENAGHQKDLTKMTMKTYHITGDLPYYVLNCNTCPSMFSCYSDACYQQDTLIESAAIAGWTVGPLPDRCPACRAAAGRPLSGASYGG